jgi:adenosine deaminase
METLELVQHFLGKGVVGFDIAGDEAGFSLANHKEAFHIAFKNDIPITAHAGEALGAKSVWETIAELRPNRIGHGVRSIEDQDLIRTLKEKNIHLEVCPSTNVQINVFPTYITHPIDFLRNQGLSVGINTDTRTITGIDLSKEYYKMNRAFGWGKEQFLQANTSMIEAAFLNTTQKKALIQKLNQGYTTTEPF